MKLQHFIRQPRSLAKPHSPLWVSSATGIERRDRGATATSGGGLGRGGPEPPLLGGAPHRPSLCSVPVSCRAGVRSAWPACTPARCRGSLAGSGDRGLTTSWASPGLRPPHRHSLAPDVEERGLMHAAPSSQKLKSS